MAQKRADVRERRSRFNSRRGCARVVSCNDEGFLSLAELEALLARRGSVRIESFPYRRYVGARISIHNRRGERVGDFGRLENRELLFTLQPARRRAGQPSASAR